MPPRPCAASSAANSIAAEMGAQGITARGGSPLPPVTTKHEASVTGEAQSGLVPSPVEEKNSPAEIPWYDKLENIDENYRKFLSCVRFVNGHQTVAVPEGGLDAGPVRVGDKSDGAGKKDGEEATPHATSTKNGCVVGNKEKGEGKVAAITTGGPALKSRASDSTAHLQKGEKEKNRVKNGAKKMKVAEKEENPSAEPHVETLNIAWEGKGKVAAITLGGPRVRDSTTHHSVVEEEKKPSKELHAKTLNTVKRKRKSSDVQNVKSRTALKGKEKVVAITTGEPVPKSRVRDSTMHPKKGRKEKNGRKNGAKKMKVVEEEGKPSKELRVETLNTVKRKKKSGDVQNAESHIASELHGVVWPTHIMERPDSEFKEKLMRLLRKPFSQGEYDTLLDKAMTRLPATKKRHTRSGVKYYNSKHERKPSYFDCHPDLAKEVSVESTSKPNQLALLRGFFFWMENIAHDDQFRPWRDDFRKYKVTMIEI